MEISFELDNGKDIYHSIIYDASPLFEIIKEVKVHDFCKISGEVKNSKNLDNEPISVKLFMLEPLMFSGN